MKGFSKLAWAALAVLGAFCLGTIALRRGEQINALWIVVAAVSIYLVAYRYYSLFIATKVMGIDPNRATPALLNNDGLDYVPTNKHILFGHHFAAIAGAGPLVGPLLAAPQGDDAQAACARNGKRNPSGMAQPAFFLLLHDEVSVM